MVNALIATSNIKIIKKLVNEIMQKSYDVRVSKIATCEDEIITILNNENIDVIFLDIQVLKKSIEKLLEKIEEIKRGKYNNSMIIIANNFDSIKNMTKYDMIADYILKESDKEETIYKVNKVIYSKDMDEKRKAIAKELEKIKYNIDYKGTNYLVDVILQVYVNKEIRMMNNLQKDIYPIVSKKYNKSINTIRCNIRHATDCMYYECDIKRLKEYFGLIDDEKPTIKDVIYTVLDRIC